MIRRIAAALAVTGAVVCLSATSAFAHVSVQPGEAPAGSYSQLSFRVPNETDNSDTTQVKVQVPVDHPIVSISIEPVPGWTVATKKSKLATPIKSDDGEITEAVSEITWSGGKIAPGEYQNFNISAGPLPANVDSLTFKAIQTYDDGTEVAWIEESKPGGDEPQHPAPVLKLTAAGDEQGSSGAAETTVPAGNSGGSAIAVPIKGSAVPVKESADKADIDSANAKATIGIVLGAIGILAAIGAIALGRSRAG